jgi:hypothetical protein
MTRAILALPRLFFSRPGGRTRDLAAALLLTLSSPVLASAAAAAPMLCTTTLEAAVEALDGSVQTGSPLVEVTRCGAVTTQPEVIRNRFYSYSSPYARSIDLTHQLTNLFGIAMGGGDGTKVMGFGYIDQTMTWDGSAVENTANVMLQDQYDLMLLRTGDLPSVYGGSLGDQPLPSTTTYTPAPASPDSWLPVVRGLW